MPATGNRLVTFTTLPWAECTDDWTQNELCVLRVRSLRASGKHCVADGVILPNLLQEVDNVVEKLTGSVIESALGDISHMGYECDRSCLRVHINQLQVNTQ